MTNGTTELLYKELRFRTMCGGKVFVAENIPLVKDHMRSPVFTISEEAGLDRALMMMRTQRIRHLPVVDEGGQMIGLISDRDLRMSMLEMEQGPGGAPKGYYLPALTKVRSVMIANVV